MASSQRWGRVTAGAVVVSLGLALTSAAASADDTTVPSSPTISSGSASPTAVSGSLTDSKGGADDGDRGETSALGLWTESSRTWLTGDGQYRSELFGSPVNYRVEDSDWAKIDTTVVPSTEPGFAWQNQAGPVTVLFPKTLGAGGVRLAADETWVSFALPDAAGGEVSVTDSTVTYRQVWPGVDVQYQVLSQGVKETLVLADPATPRSFTFDIATSEGTVLRETDTGTISVIDAAGRAVFGFGQVFAEDATGELATTDSDSALEAGKQEITSALSGDASGYQLQVALSDAWVDAEDRTWPVAVDPTVTLTTSGTGRDCYIDKAAPNTSFCSDSRIKVGAMSGDPRRGLLYFDPSGIPGSVVESAELQLWCDSANDNIKMQVHRGTVNIPGSDTSWTPWNGAADWNGRTGATQWDVGSAGGGDFSTAVFGSRNVATTDCGASTPRIPVTTGDGGKSMTELVSGWVAGTWPNDGLMVRLSDNNETNNKRAQLFSSDSGTGTKAPKLEVVSSRPSGLEGGGFQNVIAVNPTDPNIVVSGGDVSGISLSQDGGRSWTTQNDKIGSQAQLKVASLVWQDATTIFALVGNGTTGGLLRGTLASTPSSEGVWITWTESPGSPVGNGGDPAPGTVPATGTGLPGDPKLSQIKTPGDPATNATPNPKAAEHPRSVGRLLAIDGTRGVVYAGSYDDGLFRAALSTITTTPNWQLIGLTGEFIRSIDFDPGTNTLYASTYKGPNGDSKNKSGQVFRITSPNSVQTVTQLTGSPVNVEELRILGGTLYGVADARHNETALYPEFGINWLSRTLAYDNTAYKRGLFRLPNAAAAAAATAWSPITHTVGTTTTRPDVSNNANSCGSEPKNQMWIALDGYASGNDVTLWLGARNPACEQSGGERIAITKLTTTDNWSTVTSEALPTSPSPPTTVLGAGSRQWWVAARNPAYMLGKGTYTAADIDIAPTNTGTIYVAGRSGIWKTINSGVEWAPAVRSLAVTINRDILHDPTTNTLDIANVDYQLITSDDNMNTVTSTDISDPGGPSVGYSLTRDSAGTLIAALGERDTNKGGVYWKPSTTWESITFSDGSTKRPIGVLAFNRSGTRTILAAVADGGLYQSTWNGSTYTQFALLSTGMTFASSNNVLLKRAAIIRGAGNDNSVYIYDNSQGIYRGTWNTTTLAWTWTKIVNLISTGDGTGYLARHPTNNNIIYGTTAGTTSDTDDAVFRILNATTISSPLDATAWNSSKLATGVINKPGPLTVNFDGATDADNEPSIIVTEPATPTSTSAQLWSVSLANATTTTAWKSRTLDGLTSQAQYPLDIVYDPDNGNTYIATNGTGLYTAYLPNPT